MSKLNDLALITQILVFRNTQAFDRIVEKYQSPIRRFLLNLTSGDEELSNDLAQDTFIKAYTNLSSFKGLSSFKTWLFRIAYNIYYDYIRSRKATGFIEEQKTVAKKESQLPETDLKLDLHKALQMLSAIERTCVILKLQEGLSIEQIVKITQIPQGTVKSHISRGKNKLANYLKQNGYER